MMQKLIIKFQRFMQGRYGIDTLGKHLMNLVLVMLVINIFLRSGIVNLVTLAIAVYANFRMFSKKTYKRSSENRLYVQWLRKVNSKFKHLKDRKDYKYFKCPECKLSLRAPRKRGPITVTCSKCRHRFDIKT